MERSSMIYVCTGQRIVAVVRLQRNAPIEERPQMTKFLTD